MERLGTGPVQRDSEAGALNIGSRGKVTMANNGNNVLVDQTFCWQAARCLT
jgi:hypothetical protein